MGAGLNIAGGGLGLGLNIGGAGLSGLGGIGQAVGDGFAVALGSLGSGDGPGQVVGDAINFALGGPGGPGGLLGPGILVLLTTLGTTAFIARIGSAAFFGDRDPGDPFCSEGLCGMLADAVEEFLESSNSRHFIQHIAYKVF